MHLKYKINLRACNDNWMLDDTKLKNCGLRNASKFPLNENVKFNEQIIFCDESYGRNVQFHLLSIFQNLINRSIIWDED